MVDANVSRRSLEVRVAGAPVQFIRARDKTVEVVVRVGQQRRDDDAPTLEIAGIAAKVGHRDSVEKNKFWDVPVTLTPKPWRTSRVTVKAEGTEEWRLTVVPGPLVFGTTFFFFVTAAICTVVYGVTFTKLPTGEWKLVLGALPAISALALAVHLRKPLDCLPELLERPWLGVLCALVAFAVTWIPGLFYVAIVNKTAAEVVLGGEKVAPGDRLSVSVDELPTRIAGYCARESRRTFGLVDMFVPHADVTGVVDAWPAVEKHLSTEVTLALPRGATASEGTIALPCGSTHQQLAAGTASVTAKPSAHLARELGLSDSALIFIPVGWTLARASQKVLSLTSVSGDLLLRGDHPVLVDGSAQLTCAVKSPASLEHVSLARAKSVEWTRSDQAGDTSHWKGSSEAWRCVFDASNVALSISDTSPPYDVGSLDPGVSTDLSISGLSVQLLAGWRASYRHVDRNDAHVSGAFELSSGRLVVKGELALVGGPPEAFRPEQPPGFKQGSHSYDVVISAEGMQIVERREPPHHYCFYVGSQSTSTTVCTGDPPRPPICDLAIGHMQTDKPEACARYQVYKCSVAPCGH